MSSAKLWLNSLVGAWKPSCLCEHTDCPPGLHSYCQSPVNLFWGVFFGRYFCISHLMWKSHSCYSDQLCSPESTLSSRHNWTLRVWIFFTLCDVRRERSAETWTVPVFSWRQSGTGTSSLFQLRSCVFCYRHLGWFHWISISLSDPALLHRRVAPTQRNLLSLHLKVQLRRCEKWLKILDVWFQVKACKLIWADT